MRTFWWLGVNRTIEDCWRYHVKIFLSTIKIFSLLIISLLEIFIVKCGLVTKLLRWGLIISCEHCRAVIRRQPARKYYLSRSDVWYWKTIFNIFDNIKTNHVTGLPEYKNHVTAFVSTIRQSKWFRHHIKIFELVLDCESLHDFEIKLNCFQFHSRVTPDSHRDRLDAIIYEILWCGDTALLISVTCCFVCQQLNQLKVKHEILTEHQSCIMEGSQLRYIITSPDRNNWNTETVGVDCDQV